MHSDNAHPDAEAPDTKAAATPKFDRVKSVNSNNLNQALRKAIMEKAKDAEWIRNLNLDTILDADFDPEELKQEVKAFKKRILEKSNDFAINIEEMKKK